MNRLKCLLTILFFCLVWPSLGAAAPKEILSGTVIFAETAGNYTYIELKQEDKKLWIASAPFEVAVGDQIEYAGGVPMSDFQAKALDRTFDEILFVSNIRKMVDEPEEAAGAAMPDDDLHRNLDPQSSTAMPDDDLHRNLATQAPDAMPTTGEVIRAEGDLSIAELYEKRADLTGQKVSVRGKVIKLSKNILGSTWLTLADGTGSAPDNTLRITTQDEATIGETLTATGTVRTDRDLGAGYKYKLLLEDAALTR